MADLPKKRDEPKKRNEESWPLAEGFKNSWKKFMSDVVSAAMTTFDRHKRAIPTQQLPAKMRDHKLDGPLKGFMECHLDDDALLIYKPMKNGAIKLYRMCSHADLKGPKAKVLKKQLKTE
jgi:addiction module RelE/StbE family toxin